MVDLPLHGRVEEIQRRLARLEAAVEAIAASTGIEIPANEPSFDEEILSALGDGTRMEAIKLASGRLGLWLQEVTRYVGRAEGAI